MAAENLSIELSFNLPLVGDKTLNFTVPITDTVTEDVVNELLSWDGGTIDADVKVTRQAA